MAILSIPREDVQQVLEEAHAPGLAAQRYMIT